MPSRRSFLTEIWSLTRPYWVSEERWSARGLLALIVALSFASIYIAVLINRWNAAFYNALQRFDGGEFLHQLLVFAALTVVNVVAAAYQVYFGQMLQIRWRRWLTEHFLDDWLRDHTYYRLTLQNSGTDNPDQRISEDLGLFIVYTQSFSLDLLSSLVTLVSFVTILWGLSGTLAVPLGRFGVAQVHGYMVWAAALYAVIGTVLTLRIGRPLVRLSFDQQRYEADFRFTLGRLREHAESVALHHGEAGERVRFRERFAHILRNYWDIMQRQKQLKAFTWAYGQLALVFPFLVAAPRYFAQQIQLGGLMQSVQAFGQVQTALSFIINSYADIARWQAVVRRLVDFRGKMQQPLVLGDGAGAIEIVRNGRSEIHIDTLDLDLPSGAPLLRAFGLTVPPGQSLFIAGAPGCGKTTLLRAICGMWPFGRGRIELPTRTRQVMLSQKPYLPPGTLRETLGCAAGRAGDADIRRILSLCGVGELAGHLDEERNWNQSLSLTEQTCLAFARVLLQRPDLVLLDEATSALEPAIEAKLFGVLRQELPHATVISVGHRGRLEHLHDRSIQLHDSLD